MTLPSLDYFRFPPIDRHGRKQPQPQLPPSATAPAPATGGIERTPSSGPGSVPGVGSGHVLPTTTAATATTTSGLPSSSSMYDDVVDDRGFNFLCATRLVNTPLPSSLPSPPPTLPMKLHLSLFSSRHPFHPFSSHDQPGQPFSRIGRWVLTGALPVLHSHPL